MFGLMRRAPRLPYCGTCKTLGALYGQRARVVLNHDTVFLAELLLESAGEPEWLPAYRSFNCLTLPRPGQRMPIALEYAATVSVALAHFRIVDSVADSKALHWKMAARYLSPSYRAAASRLRSWQFPLGEMEEILATQTAREANPQSLAQVAEPTSAATALVFSHGARLCGRRGQMQTMYQLGARFGRLIYVLDAYDDFERDANTGDFNALRAFPDLDARAEVLAQAVEIQRMLAPSLAERLRSNVEERLGMRPRVLGQGCRAPAKDRFRAALALARSMRKQEGAGILKGAVVFATVAGLAFLFPHQARRAESWRQCLGLSMNLMALGALFAAAPPTPPLPGPASRPPRMAPPNFGSGCSGCRGTCCEACGEGCCEAACDCC